MRFLGRLLLLGVLLILVLLCAAPIVWYFSSTRHLVPVQTMRGTPFVSRGWTVSWSVGFQILAAVALLGVLVLIGFVLWGLLRAAAPERHRRSSEEEGRIIQELYHGLERLEGRVEALETILLESGRAPRAGSNQATDRSST